jgi:hypothetical protein
MTEEQAAALELGFFLGSKICLIALPKPLRQRSFGGVNFSTDELIRIFGRLKVEKSVAAKIIDLINNALAEENSVEGAKKLLDVMNAGKTTLIEAFPPGARQSQMWRVYRVGISVGFSLEESSVFSSQNPTKQHLVMFTAMTQKWRSTIPEDLAKCDLPDDIQNMVKATNIMVNETEDLKEIMTKSKELYNLVLSAR